MREVSVTCTVGKGSERHNHDLEYRSHLKHVHEREEGIVELIPYQSYQAQINAIMKPYIDEYNANVEKRYKAAWDRYNAGKIKSKPKRKDFPKMDYDYYTEHLEDTYYDHHAGQTKALPMWRELLIGLGDQKDRQNGIISEVEAKRILSGFIEKFAKKFPQFHLLGATLHLDEQGYYHAHIDYKPLVAMQMTKGLNVSISHEAAMKAMGLDPEQSLINGRDKAPLRFNAYRNACYKLIEDEMNKEGIYLMYNASARKDPENDSSIHRNLENFKDQRDIRREKDKIWDQTKEKAIEIKHQTNIVQDIIDNGEPSEENLAKAIETGMQIQRALEDVERSPKTLLRNGYNVTFRLFDQLKTVISDFAETIGKLCRKIKELTHSLEESEQENENLASEYNQLADNYDALVDDYNDLLKENKTLEEEKQQMSDQLSKRRSLNDTIKISEQFLDDHRRKNDGQDGQSSDNR